MKLRLLSAALLLSFAALACSGDDVQDAGNADASTPDARADAAAPDATAPDARADAAAPDTAAPDAAAADAEPDPDAAAPDAEAPDAEPADSGVATCGDGLIEDTELCDDVNTVNGDGCSETCEVETGWTCTGEPSACTATCGDGLVRVPETCDDTNVVADDGCNSICRTETGWMCTGEPSACAATCGDGIIRGTEACDDLNIAFGDGCSELCELEAGWFCGGEPSSCGTLCGDGVIAGMEVCDDANGAAGDGCSAACTVELGYVCSMMPSVCAPDCGDGLIIAPEDCDDANAGAGDGCSDTCAIEPGFSCTGEPSMCVDTGVVTQISQGMDGGCLLTDNGSVFCWGENTNFEVGDGTNEVRRAPVRVDPVSGAVQVSSGDGFNCALRSSGGVACWGDNDNRQLGVVGADSALPLDIGGVADGIEVAAGGDFGCARTRVGDVWCWGDNDNRQLGRGGTGTTDSELPALVLGVSGAVALTAGADHACAIVAAGGVLCWGDNDNGQIGIGGTATTDISSGTAPVGLPPVVRIAAGFDHTCALTSTTSGDVWCWGNNADGQIGDNTTTDARAPVLVLSGATGIGVGPDHSCAILAAGGVSCWGDNTNGQLGDGTYVERLVPTPVAGNPIDVFAIDGGGTTTIGSTCMLQRGGARSCWGMDEQGQLGLGTPRYQLAATALSGLPPVLQIAGSESEFRGHACARVMGNDLHCWGNNSAGQLGDGTLIARSVPGLVTALAGQVLDVSAGRDSTCAVLSGGTVSCWGNNNEGQLGDNSLVPHSDPAPVPGLVGALTITAGPDFYCTTHMDGVARCWGNNSGMQMATGNTTRQLVPVDIPGVTGPLQLAAGGDHVCARMPGDTMMCWGENGNGQIGVGSTVDQAPIAVALAGVVEIGAGQNHTCARITGGTVQCWGDNAYGQMGNGTTTPDLNVPAAVPGITAVAQLAVGNNFTLVLITGGSILGWGYGLDGHLGDGGGTTDVVAPVLMGGIGPMVHVEGINSSSWVIDANGVAYGRGFVGNGALGIGLSLRPTTPQLAPL